MRQHSATLHNAMLFFSFAALITLPPFLYVSLSLSSMTIGFVIALAFIILLYRHTPPIIRVRNVPLLPVVLIFLLTTGLLIWETLTSLSCSKVKVI